MNNNPYQAPKAKIDLPPEPPSPPLIRLAYVLIVVYTLLAQIYTVWLFLEDEYMAGSVVFFVIITALNLLIAWLIYSPIKHRKSGAWIVPGILLLLKIGGEMLNFSQGDSSLATMILSALESLALVALLVIIFSPTGKAWLKSKDSGVI